MILTVDFGKAQTGIGFRFFGTDGAFIGARVTAGIIATPQSGGYLVNAVIPANAIGVYWDCADPDFAATEDLSARLLIETNLDAKVSSRNAIAPDNAGIAILENRLTPERAALLDKLNIGAPEQPVIVIPAPPADLSLCRVFGYLETPDNIPAADAKITFELIAPTVTKSERLISGRLVEATTNADGQLVSSNGEPYVELQRNDLLQPPGTKYRVICKTLNLNKNISLEKPMFDLLEVV